MRHIIAGPWVGEFGWELMGWQGWLRAQKQEGDHFTIICQSGHEYLYQDFADEFINFDPDVKERTMWMAKDQKQFLIGAHKQTTIKYDPLEIYKKQWLTLKPDSPEQKFIKYGSVRPTTMTVLVHARSIDKLNTGSKNWPLEYWQDLIGNLSSEGLKVGSIGTTTGAHHIVGTNDLRGMPLNKLCDYIASSKLVIGPSSGPIHLAALCGTPHLVWTGHSRMPERHEKTWNPLNTDCHCIWSAGNEWGRGVKWQPRAHNIYHAAKLVLTCE